MFRFQLLSVAEFSTRVVPVLAERELENNLLIGLAQRLAAAPEAAAEAVLGAVMHADSIVGGVHWTPPHFAVVSALPGGAEQALAAALLALDRGLAGACGPGDSAQKMAGALAALAGGRAELISDEVLYELTRVVPPRPAPGAARLAMRADLPLVTDFIREFFAELNLPHPSEVGAVASRAVEAGRAHLWEDGEVRSLACQARSMLTGAAIAPVFTPRAHRGRGYASALTATLCQSLLDAGHRFVCLHAERGNATSNHIYQSIGFCAAGPFQVWAVR